MGNQPSAELDSAPRKWKNEKDKYKSFPGSAILEKTFCGSIDTTDPSEYEDVTLAVRLLKKADIMCVSSPDESRHEEVFFDSTDSKNHASAMLARALVSEVTDNPKTMKQSEMAAREKQLLKAQQAAHSRRTNPGSKSGNDSRPVGAPGGVGAANVLSSLAYAVTGDETTVDVCVNPRDAGVGSPGSMRDGRGNVYDEFSAAQGKYAVTIGLSLSRRHSGVGHPDTVTRQTAFDFNELQDRNYKYVSSTDPSGWRAGGGERGGKTHSSDDAAAAFEEGISTHHQDAPSSPSSQQMPSAHEKIPSPDVVHIPIIHINCESEAQVDQIIHSLASGEIFIPHMAILPEALSVNGISPPDLVVRFDCERNDEIPPDEWPNWCLEFMHNQLYEYFFSMGARWMKRPFSITLARKVKWKTVKHMNRYFAHAEQVIERWRDHGPQMLDPQLSYIEGGATPEEVAHPHGIYLMRNGIATNYFAPNFDPPYTTRMTRSLLENVLNKSWDRKRQEWSSVPIPKLVTPDILLAMACGCTDPTNEGFMAREVTSKTIRKSGHDAQSPISHRLSESVSVSAEPSPQHSQFMPPSPSHGSGSHLHQPSYQSGDQPSYQPGDQPSYQSGFLEEEKEEQESYDDYKSEEEEGEASQLDPVEEEPGLSMPQVETVSSTTSDGDVPSLTDEEKKTDEISEKSGGSKSKVKRKTNWRSVLNTTTDSSGDFSSQFAPSLAMSGTTVMHANVSNNQETLVQEEEEDDWAEPFKVGLPAETSQARWSKKKKGKPQSVKEMLERERKRQEHLLMKVQSGESSTTSSKKDPRSRGSHYKMTPVTGAQNKRSQDIDRSDSGVSMEMDYSVDGSSAFMTDAGSTLMGQHFAGDASVASGFKSTRLTPKSFSTSADDDENSAMMSVQESSSSLSVVPTDEELLAIGWAKAIDPTSSNYYYYTLDRKKIVWDNPLSPSQSVTAGSGGGVDP